MYGGVEQDGFQHAARDRDTGTSATASRLLAPARSVAVLVVAVASWCWSSVVCCSPSVVAAADLPATLPASRRHRRRPCDDRCALVRARSSSLLPAVVYYV